MQTIAPMTWKEPLPVRTQRVRQTIQLRLKAFRQRSLIALISLAFGPVLVYATSPQGTTIGAVFLFYLLALVLYLPFFVLSHGILLWSDWIRPTYYLDDNGLKIQKNRIERSLSWRNLAHLEIVPHPTLENISLIRFVNRANQGLIEEIPFETEQINGAAIFTLYRSGKSQKISLPVVCRSKLIVWLGAGSYFVMIGFSFYASTVPNYAPSGQTTQLVLCFVLAMAFGLGSIYLIFQILRGEIRADETKLTWRQALSGWRQVRWEEITDYYQKPSGNNGKAVKIVETPVGKLELSSDFKNIDLIADLVLERASQVERLGWESKK